MHFFCLHLVLVERHTYILKLYDPGKLYHLDIGVTTGIGGEAGVSDSTFNVAGRCNEK